MHCTIANVAQNAANNSKSSHIHGAIPPPSLTPTAFKPRMALLFCYVVVMKAAPPPPACFPSHRAQSGTYDRTGMPHSVPTRGDLEEL